MKKSGEVQLALTPPIQAEMREGKLTREQVVDYVRGVFAGYMASVSKHGAQTRAKAANIVYDKHMAALDLPQNKETRDAITCRRGCSHCCYMEVVVTWDEASLLLTEGPKVDWDLIKEQLKGHKNIPHEKRACVFLRDGECSVYANRPGACRKYLVMNEPEKCDSKKYPEGKTQVVFLRNAEMFSSAMMTIQQSGTMAEMLTKVWQKMRGKR